MTISFSNRWLTLSAVIAFASLLLAPPTRAQLPPTQPFGSPPISAESPASDTVVYPAANEGRQDLWAHSMIGSSLEGEVAPNINPASYEQNSMTASSYSLGELRREMQNQAWTKGDYRIVPYGSLRGSAIYASSRTSPGVYTLFVLSPDDEGEDTFEIDTRRTRVGLDIEGASLYVGSQCFQAGGKLEVDFHGNFVIENKPGVLLRHAYGELKNEDWRILAGQTWDVCSPLIPGVLNYSVGWSAGNIGYRRMQLRVERYLQLGQSMDLTLQGSINQNIVSDFRSSNQISPESTNWPVFQGRIALAFNDMLAGGPLTVGVGGHAGEQGFDIKPSGNLPGHDDWRVNTWSFNIDVKAPITQRMGLQGEFFTGQDLATELGGILQGVRLDSATNTLSGIKTTGGWGELWYDWTPCLSSHFGYSIDNPFDSAINAGGRTKNDFYFANIVLDVTEKLILGFEVASWRTEYNGKSAGDAMVYEFHGRYDF